MSVKDMVYGFRDTGMELNNFYMTERLKIILKKNIQKKN